MSEPTSNPGRPFGRMTAPELRDLSARLRGQSIRTNARLRDLAGAPGRRRARAAALWAATRHA